MSYLDFPRIHFSGGFTAGPSTINNTPKNYDPSVTNPDPLWNPGGNGKFNIQNCTVSSVVLDMSGPSNSPLDNAPVISTDNWGGGGVSAKIVDLDPEQQMVSMIYGLQLKIGSGDDYVIAEMEPMWFQDYTSFASYQSVLKPIKWGSGLSSALASLKHINSNLLSIKFMIGAPNITQGNPAIGNIYGTIGPAETSAPINFVPARLVRPPSNSNFNFGQALVANDDNGKPVRLTIDLGSSAGMGSDTTLTVWTNPAKVGPIQLGTMNFSQAMLEQCASVFDLDLSGLNPFELSAVANSPLSLTDGNNIVLEEDPHGLYVNGTPYVFRMEADSTTDVNFWAMQFGNPAAMEITITDESTQVLPQGAPPPPAVGRVGPGGTLVGWIDPHTGKRKNFPGTIVTGADGKGKMTIAGGNPMNFRKYIDGQVYALNFAGTPAASPADQNSFLSLLVHDAFNKKPTWNNISPIMAQYAKLYPIMAQMGIQLDNPDSLRSNKTALLQVFGLSIENPGYMPVVRDLSTAKLNAIVTWLKAQPDPS